jgi:hypothetical protein
MGNEVKILFVIHLAMLPVFGLCISVMNECEHGARRRLVASSFTKTKTF